MGAQNRIPDDPDGYDKQEFDIKPRKNEFYYKYEIQNHARKGRNGLKRALEAFYEMKSEARLEPTFDHFTTLIYGCAKAGQTKKAFELYDEGLKYFKKPSPAMVTCLMNACAESPYPEYGLKQLEWLRTHLATNFNFQFGAIHFRCMIKAYGKLGRIDLASKTFEEMIKNGIQPNTDTFNMLMIACASQKESGTLLALRIYKRMRMYDIKPDAITYSNFLRCIHYCGMGSPELLHQTLAELPAMTTFEQRIAYKALKKKRPIKEASKEFEWLPSLINLSTSITTATTSLVPHHQDGDDVRLIDGDQTSQTGKIFSYGNTDESDLMPSFLNSDNLPNLLSDDHLTLMRRIKGIQFDKLNSGQARIKLFGGAEGFLDIMKRDGCEPDSLLFTRLCALVRPDRTELLPLFHLVKEYPVIRNEYFYNTLIKATCSNYHNPARMELALCFLEEMHRDGVKPSVTTFEALAPACNTMPTALTLIDDIERCGFVVSDEVIEQLIRNACSTKDFGFMINLVDQCRKKFINFMPTKELLKCIEKTVVASSGMLAEYEKGKLSGETIPQWITEDNIVFYDKFRHSLGAWLKSVDVQEDEDHWEQFDIKSESKRQGFVNYVREFQALERAKQEALEKGQSFGNLYAKIKERGVTERQ